MNIKYFLILFASIQLLITGCKKDTGNSDPSLVKDVDGNSYKTVVIGTQTWMTENLKTTKYNDGTLIPYLTDSALWQNTTNGAVCCYNNDESKVKTYGRLYNWYAVNTEKLAPKGWHIPSNNEWKTLKTYLIDNGYGYGGSGERIAKAMASTSCWGSYDGNGFIGYNRLDNNTSGFNGLPGGGRSYNGSFFSIGEKANWWCSNDIITYELAYYYSILLSSGNSKTSGYSVRCIKD